MKSILALDQARSCGWCVGAPGEIPAHGTLRLTSKSSARTFHQLGFEIARLISEHNVGMIVYEQPVDQVKKHRHNGRNGFFVRQGSFAQKRLSLGMCAIIEFAAENASVAVREAPIGTWRKHFLGHGGLARADAKQACLTRCKQLGWQVETDDEAEACGIWDFACSLKSVEHALSTTPMRLSR